MTVALAGPAGAFVRSPGGVRATRRPGKFVVFASIVFDFLVDSPVSYFGSENAEENYNAASVRWSSTRNAILRSNNRIANVLGHIVVEHDIERPPQDHWSSIAPGGRRNPVGTVFDRIVRDFVQRATLVFRLNRMLTDNPRAKASAAFGVFAAHLGPNEDDRIRAIYHDYAKALIQQRRAHEIRSGVNPTDPSRRNWLDKLAFNASLLSEGIPRNA